MDHKEMNCGSSNYPKKALNAFLPYTKHWKMHNMLHNVVEKENCLLCCLGGVNAAWKAISLVSKPSGFIFERRGRDDDDSVRLVFLEEYYC
jgi:hypothetical protein